ncbi:MAG: glycerol acyltransferase [Alphaproteobacteria bacterium]|jgi:1-acyl-sn-glycerol-3-phosphate acyltransferase|nr:glycerol acyltransferase [Alphaproteobacteria bacterium]MBT4083286.1 glycerol acyltransferase [Alphaproteobacteria bacterium]MBT4545058.1 glycerol acyltransferase [Alphaproteobacteria bacterium]
MKKIIYDQPLVRGALRNIALWCMKKRGWRIEGTLPEEQKFVAILAHHTSNWDFPVGISVALHFKVRVFWLGKNTLFLGPMRPLMRWLGGIPVFRTEPSELVDDVVEFLKHQDKAVIGITPEGTRGRVTKWKTGFYRIAHALELPIVLAYLDYDNKIGGVGPIIYPEGDFEADMARIKNFYRTVNGKYPELGSFVDDADY